MYYDVERNNEINKLHLHDWLTYCCNLSSNKPHKHAKKRKLYLWLWCKPFLGFVILLASLCLYMLQAINLPIPSNFEIICVAYLPSIGYCFSTRHRYSLSYIAMVRLSTIVVCVALLPIAFILGTEYFVFCISKIEDNEELLPSILIIF